MELMDRMDGTRHKKWRATKKEKPKDPICSLGEELPMVEADWVTYTDAEENRRRRTLLMKRSEKASWGFTLQSYGIQNHESPDVEMLTYVDYVEVSGPAYLAGLRPGDVILSINGVSMEDSDHQDLVSFIKHAGISMRMVVLFEDCCRKVELHGRCLKLKRVLAEKIFEMRSLEEQEKRLMSGLSRFDSCRSSRASSSSSLYSGLDDRFSLRPELDICPVSPSSASSVSLDLFEESKNLEALKHLDLSASPRTPENPFRNRFSFDRSSMMSNLSAVTFSGVPSQWENGALDHLAHLPISARLKPLARHSTYGGLRNPQKLLASQSYSGHHEYSGHEDVGKKPRPKSEGQLERNHSRRRRHHSLEKVRRSKGDFTQETSFINANKSFGSIPGDLHNSVQGDPDLFRMTLEKNLERNLEKSLHRRSFENASSTPKGRHRRHSGKKRGEKVQELTQDGASSDYDNKHQEEPEVSPVHPQRSKRSHKGNRSKSPGLNGLQSCDPVDFQIGSEDPHLITPFPFHGPLHSSPYSTHSTSSEDSSLQLPDLSIARQLPGPHLQLPDPSSMHSPDSTNSSQLPSPCSQLRHSNSQLPDPSLQFHNPLQLPDPSKSPQLPHPNTHTAPLPETNSYTSTLAGSTNSLEFNNPTYTLKLPNMDNESSSDFDDSFDLHYRGYDSDTSSYNDSSSSCVESYPAHFNNSNGNNANSLPSPPPVAYPNFVLPRIQLEFINERDEITKL